LLNGESSERGKAKATSDIGLIDIARNDGCFWQDHRVPAPHLSGVA
jgi:hypothetical protein